MGQNLTVPFHFGHFRWNCCEPASVLRRVGIGTLPEESRSRIFEITHQLKETGYFEDHRPSFMPLYFEEEY